MRRNNEGLQLETAAYWIFKSAQATREHIKQMWLHT